MEFDLAGGTSIGQAESPVEVVGHLLRMHAERVLVLAGRQRPARTETVHVADSPCPCWKTATSED